MTDLLILGAGGHGRVVADTALSSGEWSSVSFLDDRYPGLADVDGFPVIGPFSDVERRSLRSMKVFVALGTNSLRLEWVQKLRDKKLTVPVIVSSNAYVSPRAKLEWGSLVVAGAVVNPGTEIGLACIVNTGATLDHDCTLGDGVHVCPGASIGGGARLGDRCWVGIGASIVHGISVGDDAVIGAGAAVISDIPSSCRAVGVPARPL